MTIANLAVAFMFTFLIIMTVVTVLFYRVSIKYFNTRMEKDGVYSPTWDKGIGASGPFYAMAIFFERFRKPTAFFDGRYIVNYARPIDKILGFLHIIASLGLLISTFIVMYLDVQLG